MAYLDQFSEEQRQAMRHDPRIYVANKWRHPGRPEDHYDFMDTKQEAKLNYLLHDDGPLNPESWGNINFLKICRGGLKSTALRMITTWLHEMWLPWGVDTYMTAPRDGQVTKFIGNFEMNTRQTGLSRYNEKDSQHHQQFEILREDGNGGTYPVVSNFKGDSGWGDGDALRGPHSHFGVIDEFQDMDKPAFDTYVPCIDRDLPDNDMFPCIFILGTPKLENSYYQEMWEKTDQKTWDAETNTWVAHSEAGNYKPSQEVLDELDGVDDIDVDDLADYEVRGWHMDAWNSPVHSIQAILRDKDNMSEMKFTNEVEADFYSPEDNLLASKHVTACFDEEIGFRERRKHDDSFVTVSADWGGGKDKNAAKTVFLAVEHTEMDDGSVDSEVLKLKFKQSGMKRRQIVRDFESWLIQYEADGAVVDYGHDEGFVEDIQDGNGTMNPDGYADIVKAAKFGNVQHKTDIKWESNSGKRKFFSCDKTRSIVRTVDAIKQGQYTIPAADLGDLSEGTMRMKIINHLTAQFKEMVETPSGTKKVRVTKDDSKNDDAMDVFTYSWLAYHEIGKQSPVVDIEMNTRQGYA